MIRYRYKPKKGSEDSRHFDWAEEIAEKLKAEGISIPTEDIMEAWEQYSDTMCAGWITHDFLTVEEILASMMPWLQEINT